jgi:adenosylmethionine-8-amino-7-oxononanoate aminotransferase
MPSPPAVASAATSTPSAVLHRNIHHAPPLVTAAAGITLTLHTGQTILDASCGAAVSCLGHAHPRIKAAVARQLDTVAYCHSLFYGTRAAEELAAELVAGTGGVMGRVFVVSSGRLGRPRAGE